MKRVLIRVWWTDCVMTNRWLDDREAGEHHVCQIESIGFLLRSEKGMIVICSSISDDTGAFGGVLAIPRGTVVRLQKLK